MLLGLVLVPALVGGAAKTIPPEKPAMPPAEASDAVEPIYGYQLMTEENGLPSVLRCKCHHGRGMLADLAPSTMSSAGAS